MWLRFAVSLLVIGAVTVFGQDAIPVRAGDLAPNLIWTKILVAAGPHENGPGSLLGQVTVLVFFPNISANEKLVSHWNQLVSKFSDQPVHFISITSEESPALDSWIEKHPVKGCLLFDPKEETAKAYGAEMSDGVMIGADGRIAGFNFMIPEEQQIRAVQEGHALAIRGDANDAQMNEILAGRAVRLDAAPRRIPMPTGKPDIAPSYEVHISSSSTNGTDSSGGPDWFVQRGSDLKSIISTVYGKDPSRIVLPASLENGNRYDFVLVTPRDMDDGEGQRRVREAIQAHFQITVTAESKPMDVCVMSTVEGKTPVAKGGEESFGGGFISWSHPEYAVATPRSSTPPTIEELRKMLDKTDVSSLGISEISASNSTMDDLRRSLEMALHRPILDETGLKGTYDIEVYGKAGNTDEFLKMLSEQQGILITPALRNIEMLVVRALP